MSQRSCNWKRDTNKEQTNTSSRGHFSCGNQTSDGSQTLHFDMPSGQTQDFLHGAASVVANRHRAGRAFVAYLSAAGRASYVPILTLFHHTETKYYQFRQNGNYHKEHHFIQYIQNLILKTLYIYMEFTHDNTNMRLSGTS